MSTHSANTDIAIIALRDDDSALRDYLTAQGLHGAPVYPPTAADNVDAAVTAGAVTHVVFADLPVYLHVLWDGRVDPGAWQRAGVQIDFAESPAPADLVRQLPEAWQRWRVAARRRAIVAGVLLSIIAIAAAFTLVWSVLR